MVHDMLRYIYGFWTIVNALFSGFWDFLARGKIIRRSAYFMMWYITFEAYHFCYTAAEASGWNATVIGASFGILTPVSVLQGAVLKFYADARAVDPVTHHARVKDDK